MDAAFFECTKTAYAKPQGSKNGTNQWHRMCHFFTRLLTFLLLLALAGTMTVQAAEAADDSDAVSTLYRYETGAALTATERGEELAALLPADTALHPARVRAPDQSQPLAQLRYAQTQKGRVLLDWQALVDPPFLHFIPPLAETLALAPVLKRHVTSDASVLAWWDVSRMLALLAGTQTVFNQPLDMPLFVPVPWRDGADAVHATEADFWQDASLPADDLDAARERFALFTQALLAPEEEGVAQLRALAPDKAVLVLHMRDLILLGQMAPQKLGVAFRDLGPVSEVHGMIQRVRSWMKDNDHAAYGLLHADAGPVRAVALTDEASGHTLIARLLPLIGNDQSDVAGTRLVYRTGGYIVYELDADAGMNSPAARTLNIR